MVFFINCVRFTYLDLCVSLLILSPVIWLLLSFCFFKPLHPSTYKQCKEEMFLGHQFLQTVSVNVTLKPNSSDRTDV